MSRSVYKIRSKGFSLLEVIIVVAIIAVILALAIPDVIGYSRSLKLTELDDSARAIFTAAQNRLTAMKGEGRDLYALSSIQVDLHASPGTATGTFYAVTAGNSLDSLVPGGSIDPQLRDNSFVVEIDPENGTVYAVWYWEKGFKYDDEAYDEVSPDKGERLKAGRMVGYYGGEAVDRPTVGQMPFPSVSVTNAEELRVSVTVPTVTVPFGTVDPNSIKLDISIDGIRIVSGAGLWDTGSPEGTVVLDTLETGVYQDNFDASTHKSILGDVSWTYGMQYKAWRSLYPSLPEPGGDITVSVRLSYDGSVSDGTDLAVLLSQTVSVKVNSLFEEAEPDAAGMPVTAHIACGRHLQNLDIDTSGVTSTVTAAAQTRDIDFDDPDATGLYSWRDTYGTSFKPVENDRLASYDGGENIIRRLHVDEPGDNAGLFGAPAAALQNIRLEDASVSGGGFVGALAGKFQGTQIVNCGVYASGGANYDTHAVTGSGGSVGGLVGGIDGGAGTLVTVDSCFAAVEVTGGGTGTGGLIGLIHNNVTLRDSYSGGRTVAGAYIGLDANVTGPDCVGGLVGVVADSMSLALNGTNYSTCSVRTASDATLPYLGLLVGGIRSGGGVTRDGKAYSAGAAFSEDGSDATGIHDESAYLETDRGSNAQSDFDTCPYDDTLNGAKYPYAASLSAHHGDWLEDTASASSLCYYDKYDGAPEYGFWGYLDPAASDPVNTLRAGSPGSGPYAVEDGYCVPVEAGKTPPSTVTVDGETYSLSALTTAELDGTSYDIYAIDGLVPRPAGGTSGIDPSAYYHKIDVGGAEYWFDPFFACEIVNVDSAAPNTPPAAPQPKPGAAGQGDRADYDGQVVIRTARQLANMATVTGNKTNSGTTEQKAAQKRAYVQLMDIDFDLYSLSGFATGKESEATSWEPMVLDKGTDEGSYNGNEFLISNLYIDKPDGEDVGLFGDTRGKLENIRLKNVKVAGKMRVGALAGRFRGDTITNCGVYTDVDHYGSCIVKGVDGGASNDGRRVGGLIGNINSEATLTGCFAAVQVAGTQEVGGLIGSLALDKNNAIFEDCYSGGHTAGSIYIGTDANVTGETYVGGLVGCANGDDSDEHTLTLKGINYSTCSTRITGTRADRIGLLIGGQTNKATIDVDTDAIVYTTGTAFNVSGTKIEPRGEQYLSFRSLIPRQSKTADFDTGNYDATLDTYNVPAFPYATNLTEHHGDWVDYELGGVGYWEIAGGGLRLKYQSPDTVTAARDGLIPDETVTLLESGAPDFDAADAVTRAGYFYVVSNGMRTIPVSIGTRPFAAPSQTGDVYDAIRALFGGDVVDVGVFDVSTGSIEDQTWTILGEDFVMNPSYASAVECLLRDVNGRLPAQTLGTAANPYEIRTARQLDNIEGTSSAPNEAYFLQTHDIDGAGHTGYTPNSYFSGHFDGGGHRIVDLASNGGLFGTVNDGSIVELKNIVLFSTGSAGITGVSAGGIVGAVDGGEVTIDNCAVAGYSVTGSDSAGGLIGTVNGGTVTITGSEAVNTVTAPSAGGLVGAANGGIVTVVRSYSGGMIDGGSAGGIVGSGSGAGTVSYTSVYSYASVSATGNLYAIGPAVTADAYESCHYWSGGLGGAPVDAETPGVTGITGAPDPSGLAGCISGNGIGAVDAGHTYPTASAPAGAYPYPAVVRETTPTGSLGEYVHYGDWV